MKKINIEGPSCQNLIRFKNIYLKDGNNMYSNDWNKENNNEE